MHTNNWRVKFGPLSSASRSGYICQKAGPFVVQGVPQDLVGAIIRAVIPEGRADGGHPLFLGERNNILRKSRLIGEVRVLNTRLKSHCVPEGSVLPVLLRRVELAVLLQVDLRPRRRRALHRPGKLKELRHRHITVHHRGEWG